MTTVPLAMTGDWAGSDGNETGWRDTLASGKVALLETIARPLGMPSDPSARIPSPAPATAEATTAGDLAPADRSAEIALDGALMARAGQGDQRAFRLLVDRHSSRAIAVAQRMLGDRAEAEDAVQDALLKLWKAAATWRPEARVGTWLHRVVVNQCIDRTRRRRPSADLDAVPEPPDPTRSAEEGIAENHVRDRVAEALAHLPDRQRAALVLCYYEGCRTAEAAEVLGTSTRSIESLLFRARKTLAEALAPLRDEGAV